MSGQNIEGFVAAFQQPAAKLNGIQKSFMLCFLDVDGRGKVDRVRGVMEMEDCEFE
jgi:hypothetical protein